jgi:hypothetical protein
MPTGKLLEPTRAIPVIVDVTVEDSCQHSLHLSTLWC